MILGALVAVAWAQAPSLWIEPGVGAWRSVSCACVDNMLGELGAGLSLPLSERVALELHPRWQAAGYPLGAGLHMWTFSAGVQLRAAEPSFRPV
ncbi:MAG: hypothetical protein H6740_27365, partial [Alphaproteobacteria bacterium]|nr:hypothetical protein [Alphaproteobacteria bacterium]